MLSPKLLAVVYAALLALLVEVNADEELWQVWKWKHNKVYNSVADDVERYGIWINRVGEIDRHNLRYELGLESYSLGINGLADRTDVELTPNCHIEPEDQLWRDVEPALNVSNAPPPASKDWYKEGAVTTPKDQVIGGRGCGACYAFAAIGALEAQQKIKKGVLEDLSIQQCISCSQAQGNKGCDGGSAVGCFNYFKTAKVMTERDFYYEAKVVPCKYDEKKGKFKTGRFPTIVKLGDENDLKRVVGTIGPASAGMHDLPDLSFHKKGIYKSSKCRNTAQYINHSVLVVGYGTSAEGDYWIIKNSGGVHIHERGFFKLARNANNMCGIATSALTPGII